ncbi:hypothetical protein [Mucilaginibacter sp. OK268]|uniref:hypothetical protein n=1 Tax=Mucilaginibacter sp. OK268 TaxID=1881048 RepID=UPI000AFBEEF6|nr:hypothetical protein [Mucilaginibacter sp. OK268]
MVNENEKPEFWESAFIDKQEMWGFEPSKSTALTKDFFVQKSVKTSSFQALATDGTRRFSEIMA